MSLNREQVVYFLSNMPVIELATMIKDLEEKSGVSASAPMAAMAAMPGAATAPAE